MALRPFLIVVVLAGLVLPARARLGESEEQCVLRYGPVVERTTSADPGLNLPVLLFNKNGYAFTATLFHGRVGALLIQRGDSAELSPEEIQLFLDANRAGEKWERQPGVMPRTVWLRDDGTQAAYDELHHRLLLSTKVYLQAQADAVQAEEVRKTQGF